ncbi:MAG TPA: SAM-dependent methyltransferase [Nitrospira sp.]|nr:SAM-dependent methyltransferase [Nitrospira sp.]
MGRQKSQQSYRESLDVADRRRIGTLYIVGTPIGSPDDLTIRALTILRHVSIVAAETPRATQALLTHHGVSATITSYGPGNCEEKIAVLLHRLHRGQDIAFVSDSGMPVIYDPGRLLIEAAHEAGIPVTVIPGPSALTAAVALSGYSGDRIAFEGRLPGTRPLLDKFFAQFRQETRTMVFLVSPRSLLLVLRSLAHILPARQLTLAIDMTRKHERSYRGNPALLLEQVHSVPRDAELTMVMSGKRSLRQAQPPRRSKGPATPRFGGG